MTTLPPPVAKQPYWDVSALEAGHFDLQDCTLLENAPRDAVTVVPSLCFLLRHSTSKKTLLFDLGVRRDWENYTPVTAKMVKKEFNVKIPLDIIESLAKGKLTPADIDTVCLSHTHFDHIGDTTAFTKSKFIVGEGTQSLIAAGYPSNPDGEIPTDLLPSDRTQYLSYTESWKPLGPFPRALDYYDDGSLYIIDAPGHVVGHINLLTRTSPDGGWIYLAGDSAHHRKLITGESKMATDPKIGYAHDDCVLAQEHLLRVQDLYKMPRVKVIIAHDDSWYQENVGGAQFWPGKIASL